MKKLLWLLLLIASCSAAHAATCPISSGTPSSTIVATIQGCGSGNTVTFAAGNYSVSTTINVPCGVSITGPTVASSLMSPDGYAHNLYGPTAIISSTAYPLFNYGTCSTPASLTYLEVNSNRPSSGGQVVYATSSGGVSNLTISYNYFHGNNWNASGECTSCFLIYFDGSGTTNEPAHSGDTISWNRLGANGDCASVMSNFSYSGYTNDGGYCAGIAWHNNMSNFTVANNFIYYQEQGIKGQEAQVNFNCVNCSITANDISNWHRIGIETQVQGQQYVSGGYGCTYPTPNATGSTITFQYNSLHDPYTPGSGTFGISSNNACQFSPTNVHPSTNSGTSNDISNVIIDNVHYASGSPNPWVGLGLEFWSLDSSSVGNNNLIQGTWANSFMIGADGAMTANNNLIQNDYGSNCTPGSTSGGWFNEEVSPANSPTGSGNSCANNTGSVQTSAAATISPASGTFSGSQVVTFTDAGYTSGVGPLGNTGIWYTTDGSNPVPGSGTAKYISTGGTITITATTTVKAVGMWGAANQPASYPTGPLSGTFGYQPSSPSSQTYTLSTSNPTITSGYLGNPGSQNTIQIGAGTIQFVAYVYYSNGTGPATLPDSYGNTATWSIIPISTTCGTVSSTGLFTPTTVGTCYVQATAVPAAGSINHWQMTVTAAPVTLQSITLASTGSITQLTIGATNQLIATGYYSDGSTQNLTTSITSWASSNNSYATIGSGGLVTGVAVGSPTFTGTYSGVTSSAFPLQIVSGVTLQTVTISTPGNVNIMQLGWTLPFTATCNFSDGSSTPCRSPVWTSSDVTKATFTLGSDGVTGVLKEIATGTGYITATQSPVTSNNYNLTYTPKAPITFSIVGAQFTFSGTSITVNYK